ncbi:MAG: hypothetical protein RBU28_04585 [Bacteroidales bacterium]|nr:hypothetical protein [Bacteroidales bacterium]
MRNKLFRNTVSLLLILVSITASGQKLVNSPYGRFNIGTLEPAGSFRSQGMGGTGTAFSDNSAVYFNNPASYAGFDTTSFIFDFGLDYSMNFLKDGSTKHSSDDMNFDHLFMGMPIARGFGLAIGLVPVSNGYYRISEAVNEGDPGYDPSVGEYASIHSGSGSLTSVFLGSGIKITRSLSAGANVKVLFGQIERSNKLIFSDYLYMFHFINTEKLQISGLNFDAGLQYSLDLKNGNFINAGASVSAGKKYRSDYENIHLGYSTSTEDTLMYFNDNKTKAHIPPTYRFGLAAGKKNKYSVGIDLVSTKWSDGDIYGADGYLADTRSLHLGAEYIPDWISNYSFLKRIEYRIGFHTGDYYLVINNDQIKERGITAGLGIPLGRSLSKANFFFDYTKRSGSALQDLHTENYITFGASLNFYDFWFVKRRYD